MKKLFDVAVVGATGLVGRSILSVLKKRDFPIGRLVLFASEKSKDCNIDYNGKSYAVLPLTSENAIKNRADIAFFCAGSEVSKKFAPLFSALGCNVIDNSSAFRMEDNVPLVIPSVNPEAALMSDGIVASPNCAAIIALSAIVPLCKKYGVRRVIYSTYQSVSGAGQKGIDELSGSSVCDTPFFGKPIKNNIIPQIGEILSTGYTSEEQNLIDETRKILNNDKLSVTATAVRVPVFYGHAVSINLELVYSVSPEDVKRTLSDAGLELSECPTPIDAEGRGRVLVGRIRRDFSHPNSFNLWVVSDNLLKGAALNAVEIAELLI